MRNELDRFFGDFGHSATGLWKLVPQFVGSVPAIEMIDAGKEYHLSAELPGMTDKGVEISVTDGILTLTGEKKEESERRDGDYLVSERSYGSFKRQVGLPADDNPEAIKAHFSSGVLNVTLGKDKKAQERLRKIPIQS